VEYAKTTSVITVQRNFQRQFEVDLPDKNSIKRWHMPTLNAVCCLVGTISKILCPRERRVFRSKLGVSSSNQCSLHHSPHTGHLEKKNKKKSTIFFGHGVYLDPLQVRVSGTCA
jgi:hypothetical protein